MKFAEWAKSSLSQQTIISFAVNLLVVTSQKKLSSGCHKPLTENRTVGKGNRIFHWVPDRTADSGSAILGERAATPSSPARQSGERCEIRHRGWGRSLDRPMVSTIFSTQDGLSWHYNIVNCGRSCNHWGQDPRAPPPCVRPWGPWLLALYPRHDFIASAHGRRKPQLRYWAI